MVPPKVMAVVEAPAQSVWLATVFTVGRGFTVMVNVVGVPGQPFAVGVTVMVAVVAIVPGLVAVNEAMLPTPVTPNPIPGLLFVQV